MKGNVTTKEVMAIEERMRARGLLTILEQIATKCHVTPRGILSQRRSAALVDARKMLYLALRENTKMSYKEIGEMLDRDHTTIMYGARDAPRIRIAMDTAEFA